MPQTTFTIHEASQRTGASIRQIDHLVAKGFVVPAQAAVRRGMSRVFDLQDVFEIAVARLLSRRLTPAEMRAVLDHVRANWDRLADPRTRAEYTFLRIFEDPRQLSPALQANGFNILYDLVSLEDAREGLDVQQVLLINIGEILTALIA